MCVSSLSRFFFLISILYVNVRNALIKNNNNKKAVTVQIKATKFGHAHHHVNIVRLRLYRALLVKEGGQEIPRYHFQNNQN